MGGTKKLNWHFGLKMAYCLIGIVTWLYLNFGNKRRMKYSKEDMDGHSGHTHSGRGGHGHDGDHSTSEADSKTMVDGLIYNKLSLLNLLTIIFSFLIINECNLNQANDPMGVTIQLIEDSNKNCYHAICAGYYTLMALIALLFFMNAYMSMNAIQFGTSADIRTIPGSSTSPISAGGFRPTTTTTSTQSRTPVLGADMQRFENNANTLKKYDMGQFVRENMTNPMLASLLRVASFASIATYFIIVMLEYFSTAKLMNYCLYKGQNNHAEVRQWGIDSTTLCTSPS